jgi:hypothetical protein
MLLLPDMKMPKNAFSQRNKEAKFLLCPEAGIIVSSVDINSPVCERVE